MRVGYLCMQSEFSVRPLEALLAAGHDVRFVMRPLSREQRRAPMLVPDTGIARGRTVRDSRAQEPFLVAARAGIPCYFVGDASAAPALALYREHRPDVLVVAFFNQLLRASAFEPLPFGAINAHPSLLPEYRGPAPLFWTFHDARTTTGVTVHRVARGEDDGAVFGKTAVDIPFGVRGEALLPALADAAAAGVVDALARMARGAPCDEEQEHARATRAPRPDAEAQRIDPSWDARRVFSFVRGVGRWNKLVVDTGRARLRCTDAVDLDEERRMPADWALLGDTLTLACARGAVSLRVHR